MPHVELLSDGKVPVVRQASILWFLVSLHSAFWRRLLSLSALGSDAGLLELRSQMWREAEIVTQLLSIMPRFPPMFVNPCCFGTGRLVGFQVPPHLRREREGS